MSASTNHVSGATRRAPLSAGATRRPLDLGRWHFQHGPIDCIVGVDGSAEAVAASLERAWTRFQPLLAELVAELPLLRTDLGAIGPASCMPNGAVAARMVSACRPYATAGTFITAMAAVAGSVAEELIGCFAAPGIDRAYVNNGGDIALHLASGAAFDVGLVAEPMHALAGATPAGRFTIDASSPVRGIATSGWRGRSFSLGIADAVTVLATTASAADAAATIVANAVDIEHPAIDRRPARSVRDDSDLGDRLVTCHVPRLPAEGVARALASGAAVAQSEIAAGRIVAAVLWLQGRCVVVDAASERLRPTREPTSSAHAAGRFAPAQRAGAPYIATAT